MLNLVQSDEFYPGRECLCRFLMFDLYSFYPGKYLKPQTFRLRLPHSRPSLLHLPPPSPPLPPLYIRRYAQEIISALPSKQDHHCPLPAVVLEDLRYNRRTLGAVAAIWCHPVSLWRCIRWPLGEPGTLWGALVSIC